MDARTSTSAPRHATARRWLRRTAWALLGLVGLVLIAVGGALAFISTRAGGEKLRAFVVEKANATISGNLSVASLSLHGGHLVLHGVVLKDPEGETVARVATVEVRVALGQLVHKRLDLRQVLLDRPELMLVQDEDGLNLQRAIATQHPKPPSPPSSSPSTFGLVLDHLQLADGSVDLVQSADGADRHIHIEGLNLQGSAKMVGDALAADMKASGAFTAPLDADLALALTASGSGAQKEARLTLSLGESELKAHAVLQDATHAHGELESLDVPPEVARAFVPTYPLQTAARITGHGSRTGDVAEGALLVEAGEARIDAKGTYNLSTHDARGVTVTARNVNLAELLAHGPKSNLSLDLTAEGGGTGMDDLHGHLELRVPASKMAGEPMGPVHVVASADKGIVDLKELAVRIPGVQLTGQGQLSNSKLGMTGHLEASDLAAFSRTLGRLAGPKGLQLKGQGALDFAVAGNPKHPRLDAHGDFPALVYQTTRIQALSLAATVPDVKDPAGLHVAVGARRVDIAPKRRYRDVSLRADGQGRKVRLDVGVHGDAELALSAVATLAASGEGGTLESLSLRYPEAAWTLREPVVLRKAPQLLTISPLELTSGAQALRVQLTQRGKKMEASAAIKSLDLGRLPKAFVDPALKLGGVLNLTARVEGTSSKPNVVAKVSLEKGQYRKYTNVSLELDASYVKERARGTLDANGEGVRLSGHFDVPVLALKKGLREPLDVDLKIAELKLHDTLKDLGIDKPLEGTASAELTLKGTADQPRLNLKVRGREVRFQTLPPANLELAVQSVARDALHLQARVDLEQQGRKSYVELKTPFTLGRLIRKPPTKKDAMKAQLALKASVDRFPLKMLSEAGLSDKPVDGELSAKADLQGSASTLHGDLRLEGKKLTTQGIQPVDLLVTLAAGQQLRLVARADQQGQPLLRAHAELDANAAALQKKSSLAATHFNVVADLGPVSLGELQEATASPLIDPVDAPPKLQGKLSGHLSASGTLHAPQAQLHARLTDFGAEGSPTGNVEVNAHYAQAKAALDLLLKSKNGGQLSLAATAQRDLSYPAPVQAPPVSLTPLTATLQAHDFDVSFLSNVTGAVEKLGGLVQAQASVNGTLRSPTVNGQLEWQNGLLYTHGNGDFTGIHLLAQGDNNRIELKDFSASSGKGKAKLYALATRTSGNDFKLHAKADVSKFPAMSDGQLMATLSLKSTADGVASPTRIFISRLAIPDARIQLPDVQRKDLQKLQPPPDVILTMRGKPIKGQKLPKGESSGTGVGGSGTAGTPAAATPAPNPMQLTVRIDAPRNLWITGNDINTEIGFSDDFRVEYAAAPQVFGDVNIIRGRLDVFGRRFDFQKESKVAFSGPPMQPDLDVTAEYKNETEQVRVYLKVQGQQDKLALHPTSDPPLPETEIYTLLATGHTSLRHGTGNSSPAGEAASLVGSLAASQLKKTLASALPLDVLSIEAGDNGLSGTKLEAGTYVNDRFYVGFTGRIGADPMRGENANEVDLEYQLSKYWAVDGSYGDARAGGASINWRKDY